MKASNKLKQVSSKSKKEAQMAPPKASSLKEATPPTENTRELAYDYGNPSVDLVKGFLHIYKDW